MSQPKRQNTSKIIGLLTFTAVVFRSELALLLGALALQFLALGRVIVLLPPFALHPASATNASLFGCPFAYLRTRRLSLIPSLSIDVVYCFLLRLLPSARPWICTLYHSLLLITRKMFVPPRLLCNPSSSHVVLTGARHTLSPRSSTKGPQCLLGSIPPRPCQTSGESPCYVRNLRPNLICLASCTGFLITTVPCRLLFLSRALPDTAPTSVL